MKANLQGYIRLANEMQKKWQRLRASFELGNEIARTQHDTLRNLRKQGLTDAKKYVEKFTSFNKNIMDVSR
jgi:hypothetical protein